MAKPPSPSRSPLRSAQPRRKGAVGLLLAFLAVSSLVVAGVVLEQAEQAAPRVIRYAPAGVAPVPPMMDYEFPTSIGARLHQAIQPRPPLPSDPTTMYGSPPPDWRLEYLPEAAVPRPRVPPTRWDQ